MTIQAKQVVKESKLLAGLKRAAQNKLHLAVWDHLIMIVMPFPCVDLNILSENSLIFPRIDITLKSSMLPTWSPPPEFS